MTGDTFTDAMLVLFGLVTVAGVAVLAYVLPLLVLDELVHLAEWWRSVRPERPVRSDDDPGDGDGWVRLVPRFGAGVPEPGAPVPPPPVVEVDDGPQGSVWETVAAFQDAVRPVRDRARLALSRAPAA